MKVASCIGLLVAFWVGTALADPFPSAEQCAALKASIHHQPDADVAYRADTNVVPAEVKPQPDAMPPHDPIKMDLKSTTGLPGAPTQPAREAIYGRITIDMSNDRSPQVLLNGRELGDGGRAQLLAACTKK